MKRLSINLLTNVLLLLVGIALIVFYSLTDVLWWVAMVMGALFAVPSLVYLFKVSFNHADTRASNDYLGVVPAVGGLCFGLVMLIKAHLFAGVITLLMGVLLSKRVINVSGWYFLAPLVVIGTGAAVLFSPELREQGGKVAMLTGLGLLLFNFTSLQEYFAERRKRKADAAAAEKALPDQPASPADTTEPHYEL